MAGEGLHQVARPPLLQKSPVCHGGMGSIGLDMSSTRSLQGCRWASPDALGLDMTTPPHSVDDLIIEAGDPERYLREDDSSNLTGSPELPTTGMMYNMVGILMDKGTAGEDGGASSEGSLDWLWPATDSDLDCQQSLLAISQAEEQLASLKCKAKSLELVSNAVLCTPHGRTLE